MANLNVRGFNPIWSFVDLAGKQFDDTFWLYTLENTIPYIPQAVYHDATPSNPWTNPIQFLANGTLPVDIYWLPNTVYRLEIRQNNGVDIPTQSDPLIYEINNYMPDQGGVEPVTNPANTSENQIANPQFAVVNFNSPTTISGTNPDPIEIAPGWDLLLSGTGTVVLNQVPLNSTDPASSNPPYLLRMTLTGWDSGQTFLRQRFSQNGNLWANKFVSTTINASVSNGTTSLSASIIDSQGHPTQIIAIPVVNTSLTDFPGGALLPDSQDTDFPPAAYIDYVLNLPNNVDLFISSIQLLVQNASDESEPAFIQDSVDRQLDHLFHYYEPGLVYKPIPSMLVGWDFPVNPAQALGDSVTMNTTAAYIWDQTIGKTVVGNVGVVRNSVTGGLQATTANNLEAFYLLQYLTGQQAKEILGSEFSVNINAFTTGATVNVQAYLFRGSSSATIPTLATTIGTIAANGNFTLTASNWTQITQQNGLGVASTQLSTINTSDYSTLNSVVDIGLNSWQITDATEISDTNKFAIVVTFQCPTTGSVVIIDSISLVPGSIPTRPAPLSYNQTLSQCQYYYRKSFLPGVAPADGATLNHGETYGVQTGSVAGIAGPLIRFDTVMRAAPNVVLYNPVGPTANQIYNITNANPWTSCSVQNSSAQGFSTIGTSPTTVNGQISAVNWTADARLGIV